MSKPFSLPRINWRRLPPLFCISLGALLGLLTVAFVLGERAEQKQAELLREYGTALAQISAQDVIDSSIGGDLVSMHAVMQRVVSQPRVIRAAVHDTNQQLLVQAGQSNIRQYTTTQEFTAPIPLHESSAGQVTLTMDAGFPGESALKWTLIGTSALLIILAALALFESRGLSWYYETAVENESEGEATLSDKESLVNELMQEANQYFQENGFHNPIDSDAASTDETELDGVARPAYGNRPITSDYGRANSATHPHAPSAIMHSDLVIALPNRARLEKQLSADRFDQLANQFETVLTDSMALYGGARVGAHTDAGIVCVRFASNESMAEAAFRAICSAYLIYSLTQISKVHFHLVAEVCHPDSDVKLPVTDTGIFIQPELVDSFLTTRIETEEVSEEQLRFKGFKGAFAALLERQQQQLQLSI